SLTAGACQSAAWEFSIDPVPTQYTLDDLSKSTEEEPYMSKRLCTHRLVLLVGTVALAIPFSAGTKAQKSSPTYVARQAAAGKTVYAGQCASCNGTNLNDGESGPPLKGVEFQQRWGGKAADTLFDYVSEKMPPGAPGSLGEEQYTRILAFLLQQIGVP